MDRERDEQISPDLFSAAAAGDTPPSPPKPTATDTTAEPTPVRHLLPKDLRNAVKHLSDGELDSLHAATLEEIKRRGRLSSIEVDTGQSATRRVPSAHKKSHQRLAGIPEAPLTRGQINAVRAAFKAGITPARIARQFGISQSNVRKALATHEPKP
jgi:DNA-binding CsgD family transcriptional regulator